MTVQLTVLSPYATNTTTDIHGDSFSVSINTVYETTNVGTVAAPIYPSASNVLGGFSSLYYNVSVNSEITVDANGDVFGTTVNFGGAIIGGRYWAPDYSGSVFEIQNYGTPDSPDYGSPTTLVQFAYGTDGSPDGGLTMDAHGNLFGTTQNGGLSFQGTIFEIKNLGTLHSPYYDNRITPIYDVSNGTMYAGYVTAIPEVIAGTTGGQVTTGEAPIAPFKGVTIGDANPGAIDTLTITIGGAGGTLADGAWLGGLMSGEPVTDLYMLQGTGSSITSELDALVFTPTAAAPNASSTTTFTLSDQSSAGGGTAVDSTTSVIDRGPTVAPTIAGTVSGLTTTSEAPLKPFAHVTVGDANVGATDTLTITLGGAGGTLSGTGLSGGSGEVYKLSGTAAAVTSELDALLFTPKAGAPNTSSTTTFTLSDQSSAGGAPVVDATTTVMDKDIGFGAGLDLGDFNNDLHSDILWQNANGQAAIWEMNGANQLAGGSALAGPNLGPSWKEIGTGDFNDDGHSDILWQNANGQAEIWEMNGTNHLAGGSALLGPNPGPSWKEIGTGDFNGDGHSDILWQNANGQAAIWEMDGTHQIPGGSQLVGPNPGPSWKEIGTGDFNGDGHSDILWQNANGQAAIWEMNGTSVIDASLVGPNPGPSWKAIGTGDFNGDGHSDILWQNANGQAAIWEMNGTNVIDASLVGPNPGPSWKAIGTGDYNGDGFSDILWQNTSGQAAIWEMDGTHQIAGVSHLVGPNPGPGWLAIKA